MFGLVKTKFVREDVISRGIRSFEMKRVTEDVFKVTHDGGVDLYRVIPETGKIADKLFQLALYRKSAVVV
jgi:hypothetical protein